MYAGGQQGTGSTGDGICPRNQNRNQQQMPSGQGTSIEEEGIQKSSLGGNRDNKRKKKERKKVYSYTVMSTIQKYKQTGLCLDTAYSSLA